MTRSRRPRPLLATLAAIIALLTVMVMPASAITWGEADNGRHPFVGLMVAQDENGTPLWRCTGTLLTDSLFLTAGHCVEPPAAHVEIWFDEDVTSGRPGNGYPFTGQASGSPVPHPDYDPNAFFLRDVGVVVLDAPFASPNGVYGQLPQLNQLDALGTQRGKQTTWFTAVGYGLQYINPVSVQADLVRLVAYPKLNQINVPGFTGDFSMLLSNNANTGGTCFGDSGGPIFLGDSTVIAAVTSYGINNCTGVGGVFRMDRSWSLDFVMPYLGGS